MKRLFAAQLQHNFDSSQVLYLTGDVNYCFVHLHNGEQILSSRTLKWYHTRWPHFIRIHKGHLVNPAHVHRCVLASSIIAFIIMRNGASLSVGRRRIPEIMQQLTGAQSEHPRSPEMVEYRDYEQLVLAD
ncbi:LytR/AlgR family response regulator transcription factor [Spirosoma gilvum]